MRYRDHCYPATAAVFCGALLLALTACDRPTEGTDRQAEPASFTDQLRPRYWIGDDRTTYSLDERMAHYKVPGVAVAVLSGGQVVYADGFGVLQAGGSDAVDADTVFSVGSVSKVATAMAVLRLAADGVLDLDRDVSDYLTSWSLPANDDAAGAPVTLRMVLSHTAGFNIHGFGDFAPGEPLPTAIQTLAGTAPAPNEPLRLLFRPGSGYKYSGGGYTLAQVILADVSGQTFEDMARDVVFAPLGMARSTFANPLPEDHGNIARAHDRDGQAVALPRGYEAMPEMAASGLWTSANDLGTMVAALVRSYRSADGFLPQALARDMMTKVAPSQHGLGPRLEGSGETFFFHHAGTNNSYRAWIEGHLATGDGLVVLTNGAQGGDLFVEVRNGVADAMGWRINAPIRLPESAVGAPALQSFTGTYTVDRAFPMAHRQQMVRWIFDADLSVFVEGGTLMLQVVGRDTRSPLIPTAPNRFVVSDFDMREGIAELEFHRNAFGVTTALTWHVANAQSHYTRKASPAGPQP